MREKRGREKRKGKEIILWLDLVLCLRFFALIKEKPGYLLPTFSGIAISSAWQPGIRAAGGKGSAGGGGERGERGADEGTKQGEWEGKGARLRGKSQQKVL